MEPQMRDPRFREALADVLARMMTQGEPAQVVVIGMDRTLTPPSISVYGPYDGPQALIEAQKLRDIYDSTDLADVEVHIGAWYGGEEIG